MRVPETRLCANCKYSRRLSERFYSQSLSSYDDGPIEKRSFTKFGCMAALHTICWNNISDPPAICTYGAVIEYGEAARQLIGLIVPSEHFPRYLLHGSPIYDGIALFYITTRCQATIRRAVFLPKGVINLLDYCNKWEHRETLQQGEEACFQD